MTVYYFQDNEEENNKMAELKNDGYLIVTTEATDEDAKKFYQEYSDACENVLVHHMYQWDAMPILSVLSK